MSPPDEESRIHIEGLKPADIALLKSVASEAAEQAVSKTFTRMGMDPDEPFEAQKDMMFLRALRERREKSTWHAMSVAIGLLIAAAIGAVWAGFKSSLKVLPPVIILLLLLSVALAQDVHRTHPPQDMPLHEQFYSTWYMPDQPTKSCCNKADCYPTEIEYRNGEIYARRREDGKFIHVPKRRIEQTYRQPRESPDGRNHICAPPPAAHYPPDTVFCFTLGSGT